MVRVRYTATLKTGDERATFHGQKGVMVLHDQEDMPWVHDTSTCEIVIPDLVVSTESGQA